jgi:hypothetical protein
MRASVKCFAERALRGGNCGRRASASRKNAEAAKGFATQKPQKDIHSKMSFLRLWLFVLRLLR